jgi:hypothetical protein
VQAVPPGDVTSDTVALTGAMGGTFEPYFDSSSDATRSVNPFVSGAPSAQTNAPVTAKPDSSGSASVPATAKEAELARKERDLERRQAELQRREAQVLSLCACHFSHWIAVEPPLKRRGLLFASDRDRSLFCLANPPRTSLWHRSDDSSLPRLWAWVSSQLPAGSQKNFPKFYPLVYHNIEEEIPLDKQRVVRIAFYSYLGLVLCLSINWFAVTCELFRQGATETSAWLYAGIYVVTGVFGAWYLWCVNPSGSNPIETKYMRKPPLGFPP